MGKKVLVRSRFRNPLVRTTRDWERVNGKLQEVNGYRQFADHHSYMTPKEAAFIVDSDENQRYIDGGTPPLYYYPAGAPLIVDDTKDGNLSPPLGQGGLIANNTQQAEAARKAMAEGEAQIAAREANTADRAKQLRSQQSSAASKIDRPANADSDDTDNSRPLAAAGVVQGASPVRISNPDLPGDTQAPDFGP